MYLSQSHTQGILGEPYEPLDSKFQTCINYPEIYCTTRPYKYKCTQYIHMSWADLRNFKGGGNNFQFSIRNVCQ